MFQSYSRQTQNTFYVQ